MVTERAPWRLLRRGMLGGFALVAALGACTLDLVGVNDEAEDGRGPTSAWLSVTVELGRMSTSPSTVVARVRGVFVPGRDAGDNTRAADVSDWWLGETRLEPQAAGSDGLRTWNLETPLESGRDTLRLVTPAVAGLGGGEAFLIPLTFSVEPEGAIELGPDEDLTVRVTRPPVPGMGVVPNLVVWDLALPPVSIQGRYPVPPALILARPLLEGIASPTSLVARVQETFTPSSPSDDMYRVVLSREIRVLTSVSIADDPQ